MVFNVIPVVILAVWIALVSVWLWRVSRHYNRLTGGVDKRKLHDVLEGMLTAQKGLQGQTKELYKAIDDIRREGLMHIQRIGLVRFNPFSDTGGAQSFTLALLDGNENGLVITSLYARTGHRWYIKEVASGKGKAIGLSKEEQDAIRKAKSFEESKK